MTVIELASKSKVNIDRLKAFSLELLKYRFNVLQGKESILKDQALIDSYLPKNNGRIAELFYPLVSVSPAQELREKLRDFAEEEYNKRLEEDRATVEAELVEALLGRQKMVGWAKF